MKTLSFLNFKVGRVPAKTLLTLDTESDSLTLRSGLNLIVAPNGYGKTTFLQTLAKVLNPLAGDMFLFVARNRKQARVLFWDGSGLVIIAKRLEKNKFNAPWAGDRTKPWCLTQAELALFLEGSQLVGHYDLGLPPPPGGGV